MTTTRALGRRSRAAVLVFHVVSAAAWIGTDVVVACLVVIGRVGDDARVRGLALEALARFVVTPMLVAGLACLASGLLLGLGTRWGLVRYWWVLVKLLANVVLCTLILVLLRPGMPDVARYGRELASGAVPAGDVSFLAFPPAVSLSALVAATLIAVVKPWGRTRWGRARSGRARSGEGRPIREVASPGATMAP